MIIKEKSLYGEMYLSNCNPTPDKPQEIIVDYVEDYNFITELVPYVGKDQAESIYQLTHGYILTNFGHDFMNLKGLCSIMPKELCKLVEKNEELYKTILWVIFVYKMENNLDIGFNREDYIKAYNLYEQNQERKKKYRNNKKKVYNKVCETFDEYKDLTYNEYISNLIKKTDIKLIKPHELMNDYTGFKNDKIEVIQSIKKPNDLAINWICKCSCGSYFCERTNRIKKRKSCGKCDNYKDHIGEHNGHLEIIDQKIWIKKDGYSKLIVRVKCDCGNIKVMSYNNFLKKDKYCGHDCSIYREMDAKSAKEKGEFKKIFYNNTNIFKLDKKKETDINHNNTSGYLGVSLNKQINKYLAYINFQHKRYDLGFYGTASYASKVRQQAQAILYGEYADTVKDDEFIKNNKYLTRLVEKLIDDKEIH